MPTGKYGILLSVAMLAGCAPHLPQTYRLLPESGAHVLAPPGVAPSAAQGVFTITLAQGRPPCLPSGNGVTAQGRGGKLRVQVARDELLQQPAGWLRQWTADAESRGCIPPGTGLDFAARILESVPMDPAIAYRLMHADSVREGFVELGPENRLQARAPILRSGVSSDAPLMEIASTSGSGGTLNVDVRATDATIGVETSWYELKPKTDGLGSRIVPVSVERSISGRAETAAAPLKDYFAFAPQIGFYRLIYKSDINAKGSTTEIIVGAPDRVELEKRTRTMLDDPNACATSDPLACMAIPRHVAVNPYLAVTVNGQELRLEVRATVRAAVRSAGGPQRAEEVLAKLQVLKPYGGKMIAVDFDRANPAILDLTLLGGESISWK